MTEQQSNVSLLQGPEEASIFAGDEQDIIDELLVLDALVSEILAASANGDYARARALRDEYLVHYPDELFDEVIARLRNGGVQNGMNGHSESPEVSNE
jgi:hypothetical protein